MNCHFLAREKAGADPRPRSAECQDRSKTTSIGNTACCNHWNWSDGIDHRRNERQARNCSADVATSLPSLSDNDVDVTFYGLSRLLGGAHGMKHYCSARLSSGHESRRLAPEEGDDWDTLL